MSALAQVLGYSPSTIRRWKRSGVPKRGKARELLSNYRQASALRKAREAEDLKTLKGMLAEARKLDFQRAEAQGITSSLLRPKNIERRTEGKMTQGFQWVRAYRRLLGHEVIGELATFIMSRPKKFPLWQVRAVLSQFSKKEDFGLGGGSPKITEVFVKGKNSSAFLAQKIIPTPRKESKQEAANYIIDRLLEQLTPDGISYLLSIDVYNYRLRSGDERRKRETLARYERSKKWQKKTKKQKSSPRPRAAKALKPSKRKSTVSKKTLKRPKSR